MNTRRRIKKDHWGYFFIFPFFAVFAVFNLYPILYTLRLSFTDWDGIRDAGWVGAANYIRLLGDRIFWKSVLNTIFITVAAGGLQLVSGLVLAYVLNQKFIKGPHVFKNIFYFPNLVTAVSLGVLFNLLFAWQRGSVNLLLESIGLIGEPVNWMINGSFVRAVLIFIIWFQYFGYYIIIFTAGIKGISGDILEAAAIDGAGSFKTFILIVLPLLKPVITYACVTILIGGMQLFDIPYIIGKGTGAPNGASLTALSYMYNTSFKNYNYGYGAAISYGLFLLTIIFSVLYMRGNMKSEEER